MEIRVYMFFSFYVSGEISYIPGLEGNNKIGWGIIIVPYQEQSCALCTCDNPAQWRPHEGSTLSSRAFVSVLLFSI
jgi:hypothetical protein